MSIINDKDSLTASYIIDIEDITETARLIRLAQTVAICTGLLPGQITLPPAPTILDIACGPGEWAMAMAHHYPQSYITGIDINQAMIAHAQQSSSEQGLHNACFQVMDAREALAFPDASFDLIHMRFLMSFMATANWPTLLHECLRLLKPGGVLCSVEVETLGVTTSPAHYRYNTLLAEALRRDGHSFTSEGDYPGIYAAQPSLVQRAGFEEIQQQVAVMNGSQGMPMHQEAFQVVSNMMKSVQPFLIKMNVATQEEVDALYTQALYEMQKEDFCLTVFFQSIWGKKPV